MRCYLDTETVDTDPNTCVVIYAMYVVNTIVPKPSWVETGNDLAKEFLTRIDERCKDAKTVAIAFDTYRELSLKITTRADRMGKTKEGKRKNGTSKISDK